MMNDKIIVTINKMCSWNMHAQEATKSKLAIWSIKVTSNVIDLGVIWKGFI